MTLLAFSNLLFAFSFLVLAMATMYDRTYPVEPERVWKLNNEFICSATDEEIIKHLMSVTEMVNTLKAEHARNAEKAKIFAAEGNEEEEKWALCNATGSLTYALAIEAEINRALSLRKLLLPLPTK